MASEVKGIWFESTRGWLLRTHGPEALARVEQRLAPELRGLLRDPMASQWYPESALAELLAATRAELTDGSARGFVAMVEDITLDGVGRFFRLLLSLASPGFVLRKVPVLWSRMRRGSGRVEVETLSDRVRVRYSEFPWFNDENYRLMTLATIQGICRAAGSRAPVAEVVQWSHDTLDVDVFS
ncbi:MAG: hypothetical protein IAG13_14670 [Deltaproteobacteria bacterium]|nr:hypothetical protein [Nannocystaceae bacterium]